MLLYYLEVVAQWFLLKIFSAEKFRKTCRETSVPDYLFLVNMQATDRLFILTEA